MAERKCNIFYYIYVPHSWTCFDTFIKFNDTHIGVEVQSTILNTTQTPREHFIIISESILQPLLNLRKKTNTRLFEYAFIQFYLLWDEHVNKSGDAIQF